MVVLRSAYQELALLLQVRVHEHVHRLALLHTASIELHHYERQLVIAQLLQLIVQLPAALRLIFCQLFSCWGLVQLYLLLYDAAQHVPVLGVQLQQILAFRHEAVLNFKVRVAADRVHLLRLQPVRVASVHAQVRAVDAAQVLDVEVSRFAKPRFANCTPKIGRCRVSRGAAAAGAGA